jgi:hypothetical protein
MFRKSKTEQLKKLREAWRAQQTQKHQKPKEKAS